MRISGAVALIAVAALTASCSSDSGKPGSEDKKQSAASNSGRDVNKSLTITQDDGSALVTLVSVFESYQAEDKYAKPPKNGNFVAATLKFEHKAGGYEATPSDFKLRKPDGTVVGFDDGEAHDAVPVDEWIPSGSEGKLTAGESATGTIAFDTKYDAGATIVALDTMGVIVGLWPLSGEEPVLGDGSPKKEINKALTHKVIDDSAQVTLVSVAESKGGVEPESIPKSGAFVILELKFEGKAGEYNVNTTYLKLKTPDGSLVRSDDGNARNGVASFEDFSVSQLAPGKSITGKMAFDAPLKPGTKIVLTEPSGRTSGEWVL